MNPFPAEHELIELFEVEPTLLDRGVSWAYNSLTFDTTRGEDRLVCEICPRDREVRIRWSRGDAHLVRLDLRRVGGLSVERVRGREVLVGTFAGNGLLPVRLQLRPRIHLPWGTTDETSTRQPAG